MEVKSTAVQPDHHQDNQLESELAAIKASYDQFPYKSYAFAASHPAHLRALAKLVGLDSPPLATARVLELGCASGGNIIPFAAQYPTSNVVGIDLSEVEINAGRDFIQRSGLTNIELKACSITDVDASWGKFDYIIAHGVFSWVPDAVRDAMLRISAENLVAQGVAYISYNTLPGWNTLRTIRDMALYHSVNFDTNKEKVNQSKLLLNFISDAVQSSDNSYARLLMESVELLKDKEDYYIAHDFLELNNKPFYFSEFMQAAQHHGLQYLSDASIATMFLGNYPASISEQLAPIKDIVRTEQYLDFITNRTFRATLLCHEGVSINRNLNSDVAEQFLLRTQIIPIMPWDDMDIYNEDEKCDFYFERTSDKTLSTQSPILKAVFYALSRHYNQYVVFDDIANEALALLENEDKEAIVAEMNSNLLKLILSGHVKIRLDKPAANFTVGVYPKAWEYAKAQSSELDQDNVTNLFMEGMGLNPFEKYMIRYLDGKSTKEEILDKIMIHVRNKELDVNYFDKKVISENRIRCVLSLAYIDAIERFAENALLV
ncbi:MAG: hypothetical protein RI909_1432 [Bacteroidota bacterium]